MNCLDCREYLQKRLDGELAASPDAGFDGHLAQCGDCREMHAACLRLSEGLRLLRLPVPAEGLAQRIASQILADRRRRQRRRLLFAPALAAAVLLVCVGVYAGRRPASSEADAPQLAQVPVAKVTPSLQESVEEAGSAMVALTRRTADETVGQSRLLLPTGLPDTSLADPRTVQHALEAPGQPLEDVKQGMTAALEPMTTSARRAVDLFRREIPAVE